jgi:hypothetical protein
VVWGARNFEKAYVTVVAMAKLTFQNGGYFPFKVI